MSLAEIHSELNKTRPFLIDMEWQRVIPDEPFIAYGYKSIVKRAAKEGISIDNLIEHKE